VLAFPEGAVKKELARLEIEMCCHLFEGAVKKMLASLEMCWHFQKELLKKC
jgi:hypothetical protein